MLAKLVVKQVLLAVVHSIMEVFMPMKVISVKQVGRGVNADRVDCCMLVYVSLRRIASPILLLVEDGTVCSLYDSKPTVFLLMQSACRCKYG